MPISLIVVLCAIPIVTLFLFAGSAQSRMQEKAMRDFAGLLDGGTLIRGDCQRGPRAVGRWKGVNVTVRFFGRLQPPVFLTGVTAARRESPIAALLVPRQSEPQRSQRDIPAPDAPEWIAELDRRYDAGCAPKELFRVIMDEPTARLLNGLENTEIEVLQTHVSVQRREILSDAAQLKTLLDVAVEIGSRLEAHAELTPLTAEERGRREAEIENFLASFRR